MTMSQDTAKKIENIEGKTWAINNKQIVVILIAVIGAAFSAGNYWTNTTNTADNRFNKLENMLNVLNFKDSLRIQSIDYKIDHNQDESTHRFEVIEKKLSLRHIKIPEKAIASNQQQPKGYTQTRVNGLIVYTPVY